MELEENSDRCDPEDNKFNASEGEYDMQSHGKFSTEPTKKMGHLLSSRLDYPWESYGQDNS